MDKIKLFNNINVSVPINKETKIILGFVIARIISTNLFISFYSNVIDGAYNDVVPKLLPNTIIFYKSN
jgi:hypothetical protein